MMEISVHGRLPFGLTSRMLEAAVAAGFRSAKVKAAGSVSVVFVSDAAMQKLNRIHRKKDKTTDVLSFSEPELPLAKGMARHWGDIVVSPATVKREAKRRNIEPAEEALRDVIHGTLHLLGFDHADAETELDMFTRQEKAVASILV